MSRFETFTKSLVARGRARRATIQRRGTITLNAAAYDALGSPDAVELLFDEDAKQIGLRACPTDLGHAAFVRPATKSPNGPYVVSAMAFLKYYDVDTTEARRWPVSMNRGLLCLDLDGPHEVVSKNRSRNGAEEQSPAPASRRPKPR